MTIDQGPVIFRSWRPDHFTSDSEGRPYRSPWKTIRLSRSLRLRLPGESHYGIYYKTYVSS